MHPKFFWLENPNYNIETVTLNEKQGSKGYKNVKNMKKQKENDLDVIAWQ